MKQTDFRDKLKVCFIDCNITYDGDTHIGKYKNYDIIVDSYYDVMYCVEIDGIDFKDRQYKGKLEECVPWAVDRIDTFMKSKKKFAELVQLKYYRKNFDSIDDTPARQLANLVIEGCPKLTNLEGEKYY